MTIEKQALEESCKKILALEKIRFAGVLNNMGNHIAGGFKEGVTSKIKLISDDIVSVHWRIVVDRIVLRPLVLPI